MGIDHPDGTKKNILVDIDTTAQLNVNLAAQTLAAMVVDIISAERLDVNLAAQSLATLAVDIATQTLAAMKVNITAQTLSTLAVDIAAQTIAELAIKTTGTTKLAVDIATQTLTTLGINIKTQDLAQLVIKVAAQTVGIHDEPQWETLQGKDKDIAGSVATESAVEDSVVAYTVTAGKTLYITGISFKVGGGVYNWELRLTDGGTAIFYLGGSGGDSVEFVRPKAISAGVQVVIYGTHYAGAAKTMYATISGYEI